MSGHKIWKDPRRVDQNDDWDIGIGKSRLVSGVVLKIANAAIVSPFLPQNAAAYFARSIPGFVFQCSSYAQLALSNSSRNPMAIPLSNANSVATTFAKIAFAS
jgi:hypothetical protein